MLPEATARALALDDEAEIEPRLAVLRRQLGSAALSEYAFANLYLFRTAHAYRYLPGPYPCVSGLTYDGVRHLLPLFDLAAAPAAAMAQLLADHHCFFPLAAATVARLDPALYNWTALPEDADYLYPAENFRDYRGDSLRKKRGQLRQLLAAHGVVCQPLDAARRSDALRVLQGWMQAKGKGRGEADEAACGEALHLAQRFALDGEIYYAGDQPIGFLLAQSLAPGLVVMRFAKGDDAYPGIYPYMFHDFCLRRAGRVDWLNFEQDLGLANFRKTKRSYRPSAQLAKFRVHVGAGGDQGR